MPIPDEDKQVLTPAALAAEGLDDWRVVEGMLRTRFASGTFATGLSLVDRIGAEAERADHHPDIDLRYPYVDVALASHDVDGITQRDVRLARAASAIAADLGVAAEPPGESG
jgi:4a-hydroxytetrahydrobiopterin dehydratase